MMVMHQWGLDVRTADVSRLMDYSRDCVWITLLGRRGPGLSLLGHILTCSR